MGTLRVLSVAFAVLGAAGAGAIPAAAGRQQHSSVTFTREIAPILYEHCASCHRPDGAAPFSLLTYESARSRARLLAEVTRRRYMPPWKPEPGFGDFIGARGLTDGQIALIQQWVAAGAQEGYPRELPPVPSWESRWALGAPDLVLTLPEPYELRGTGSDVFRTFVLRVPLDSRKYVRALEFRPGNLRAVHHANLKIDPTRSTRTLDDSDPAPGFEGAGGRGARFPDGHFLGWTPGQTPAVAPEALAWRLDAGSDLVVELHMMPTGKPEPVQPSVALYFTDRPPSRLPSMIRLGRQDIDIPAGEASYVSTDSYELPVDAEVLAVQPHAHRLARDIQGFAVLPDGATKWLMRITDWDLDWQDVYRFREPLSLPKGTRLTMRYTYDNSAGNARNPNSPPMRVTFGQTTSSEMGDLWIQVLPRTEADRLVLDRDFAPKMLRDDVAGVEKMLESHPRDARLLADLAFCYLELGREADALVHLREAARLEPDAAGRHYDIGGVLLAQRAFAEARRAFQDAVRLEPDFGEAYNNLGVISHAEGKLDEAIEWYSGALRLNASNAEARYNLGRALASRGDHDAALLHYREALRIKPDDAPTHGSLGTLLATRQQLDEAVVHYRRALQLDPDLPGALVDLAWILATAERSDLRAPDEAVRLAERASRLTAQSNPTVLDTLAAAYAAAGQLERAIATAEQALALATASGSRELSERIRERLAFYKEAALRHR